MSANQTNIDCLTPLPGGGHRCVISDGSPILPLAMRIMEETGANRVRVRLAPDGVENPTVYTAEIDRSGGFRFISRGPDVPSDNPSN